MAGRGYIVGESGGAREERLAESLGDEARQNEREDAPVAFAVFEAPNADDLAKQLNAWTAKLPPGVQVRRTQLCSRGHNLVALVNWTAPKKNA